MEEYLKEFLSLNNIHDGKQYHVDERIDELALKLPIWLEEVDQEHHMYFLMLLKYFQYFDRKKIHDGFLEVYERYKLYEPEWEKTIYAPISPKIPIYNGTNEFFHIFREVCKKEVKKTFVASQFRDFLKTFRISSISNYVLIDDIIGTGSTLKDFIEPLIRENPEKFEGKKIYILCLVAHPKGLDKIEELKQELKIDISCIYTYKLKKAFENDEIFKEEVERKQAKKILNMYEKRIAKRKIDVMGYKNSQGLVAFFYNTPNNTLSVFWEQEAKVKWNPLFPRSIRGEELPLDEESSLESIRKRKNKKDFSAQYIFEKIKSVLLKNGQ